MEVIDIPSHVRCVFVMEEITTVGYTRTVNVNRFSNIRRATIQENAEAHFLSKHDVIRWPEKI